MKNGKNYDRKKVKEKRERTKLKKLENKIRCGEMKSQEVLMNL